MKQKTVILGVTGSIACYKSVDILKRLSELGVTTEVILTKSAEQFIRPLLFQAVSGTNVITADLFKLPEIWSVQHITLAEKANLLLVAPATADIISKIANGLCDDMLTCTICATKAPVLLAPAMNAGMYTNRILQENIKRLRRLGYYFTGPIVGKLACGKKGIGHIQDIEKIIKEVKRLLA